MKAVLLKEPGSMEVVDLDDPSCPPGGMVVKVGACAICSSDVHMFKKGHQALKYPVILGHEIAGTVVHVSSSGCLFKVGDRVVVGPGISCGTCDFCLEKKENLCSSVRILGFNHPGGMAQYVAVTARMIGGNWIKKIPGNITFEDAALAEPLACCINGLDKLRVGKKSKVLIIGGGPMGCLMGWLCKERGAGDVMVAEKLSDRRKRLRSLGAADRVFKDVEESESFNILVLASRFFPRSEVLNEKLQKGGQVLLFSGIAGESVDFSPLISSIHYKEWSVIGAYGCRPAQIETALRLISSGRIPAGKLIDCTVDLDNVFEAFGMVDRKGCLKAVVLFQER